MKPRRKHYASILALTLAALLSVSGRAAAQGEVLDAGTFRLLLQGREVGSDSFTIRRTGTGGDARIFAQGETSFQDRRLSTIVETDANFGFTQYQARISGSETALIDARRAQRLEVSVRSAAGERTRELRLREGAVVVEEHVPHLYYFIGQLDRVGAVIPVIAPQGNDQAQMSVLGVSSETVSVGGRSLDARVLRLSLDGVERRVWVDARGRVLRVEIPSTGYVAERLRPPA